MRGIFATLLVLMTIVMSAERAHAFGNESEPSIDLTDGIEYRIGDSPYDERGVPVWTYGDRSAGEWIKTGSMYNPPGRGSTPIVWFRVPLPQLKDEKPVIMVPLVLLAYEIWIGQKMIHKQGIVDPAGQQRRFTSAAPFISLGPYNPGERLYIRVYSNYRSIGMYSPIRIGTKYGIMMSLVKRESVAVLLMFISLFIGLYCIIIAVSLKFHKGFFGYSFFCISNAVYNMFYRDLFHITLNVPEYAFLVWVISVMCVGPIGWMLFIYDTFGHEYSRIFRWFFLVHSAVVGVSLIVAVFWGSLILLDLRLYAYFLFGLEILFTIYVMLRRMIRKDREALIMLLASLFVMSAIMFNMSKALFGLFQHIEPVRSHWSLFLLIMGMGYILIRRYIAMTAELTQAKIKVEEYATGLERKVVERTADLNTAMEELEQMNDNLSHTVIELEKAHRVAQFDLSMAINVQRNFLPRQAPKTSEWDIAYAYLPMSGISGDFYDFYCRGDVFCGMGLFDVSGHGIASGLITTLGKSIVFRNFMAGITKPLGAVMTDINTELQAEIDETSIYITGVLLRFTENRVEYVNAGHSDVLVKRNGTVSPVCALTGQMSDGYFLGIKEFVDKPFSSIDFTVEPGDCFVICTDGLYEEQAPNGEQFGLQRLSGSLLQADGPARDVLSHMLHAMYDFSGKDTGFRDDITAIVLKKIK